MPAGQRADDSVSKDLALAERGLSDEVNSGGASMASSGAEAREALQEGERISEELERRSNVSSAASRSRTRMRGQEGMEQRVEGSGISSSVLSADKPLMDKVELALLDAKRAMLAQDPESCGSGSASVVGSSLSETGSGLARSSTFGPSSGIVAAANVLPSAVVETLPEEARNAIENTVAKVILKSGQELAEMQVALDKTRQTAVNERDKLVEMEAKVVQLKAKANINENLSEALSLARKNEEQVVDERDNLLDKLAGMEARLNAKMERHEKEVADIKQQTKETEEEVQARLLAEKKALTEELTIAVKEVERAKKQKILISNERDVVARSESLQQKAAREELKTMKDELHAARYELESQQGHVDPANVSDEKRALEEKLKEQRERNLKMSEDLASLRIEMLQVHKDKEDELATLKAKVEVASTLPLGIVQVPMNSGRKKKGQPQRMANILPGIEEDDDVDMRSQAGSGISGQVSGCDVGVGDLRDFDDPISPALAALQEEDQRDPAEVDALQKELREAENAFKNLQDDRAAQEAEHTAKISRLQQQLQVVREEASANRNEVERLKQVTEEIDAEKETEILKVKHKLNNLQELKQNEDLPKVRELEEQVRDYIKLLDEAKQQLAFALESKRMLEHRLADTQAELEATETRHTRTIKDLQARLQLSSGGGSTGNDVLDRLQAAEEERNVFRNELECQKVHWQARLENEQQEIALLQAKLKEEQKMANKDMELRAQVEESLREQQRLLALARQAQKEAEERADRETVRAKAAVQQAAAAGRSWGALLRCPMRSNASDQLAASMGSAQAAAMNGGAGGGGSVNAQVMVWQTIASMGGATALLCHGDTLKIMDASKKAFSMWGSSALRGSCLTTLVFDSDAASWLESELTSSTSPFATPGNVQGFWLRELGCVEFRSKLGSGFDSSVTAARLPEEPPNREAVVVVIVEPLEVQAQPANGPPGRHPAPPMMQSRPYYRRGAASTASSVHSEDITANDSVSNVNVRY